MASIQTKPKGRKRKLLPSDYTEFGDPRSVKSQQNRDKLDFSGTSDIEKDSFREFSDLNGQKKRTNLLDVSNFHGDLLPLSQAGKFIPKFQTKVIRKINTSQITSSENVRKKGSVLVNVLENKRSAETESFDCNFQQSLETHSMNDSKNSKDNSELDNLLFNEERKQAADCTSHTFDAVEIAVPRKKKLNLTRNYGHDEHNTEISEDLIKKKGKGRLQRMSEKTLGIRKVKSTGAIHMNMANDSCSTNGIEGENMTTVNNSYLKSGVVSETLKLETSADGDSQSSKNSEQRNLYPDNMNIAEIKENLDWINNRIEVADQKLIAADAVVEIERLKLSQKESYGSEFPQMELHAVLDEIKNDCSMTDVSESELNVKSDSTGQHHQLDVSKVTASTEFDSKVANNSQPFLSNSKHMNSEADQHAEDRIMGSARSQQAGKICPKIALKPGDQLSATMPTTYRTTYDQKTSNSEKRSQHIIEMEQINSSNCKAEETLQNEITAKCTEPDIVLGPELDQVLNIKLTGKCNAEAVENCGENKFIAELASVGKGAEITTQLQFQSNCNHSQTQIQIQNSNDLGQEQDLNQQSVQSAHQELYSTFDDFPDVTDSQMYLLDEESVTKPSLTNIPMPSTAISCPGLAKLSKALDIIKSADSVHINEAKRREGNKILQNLIKELTSVNAQLLRHRRQIEKAKKERMEHLRSTSCARQY